MLNLENAVANFSFLSENILYIRSDGVVGLFIESKVKITKFFLLSILNIL